eukprot:15469511-Alexandrium_andersonii.AAC.1
MSIGRIADCTLGTLRCKDAGSCCMSVNLVELRWAFSRISVDPQAKPEHPPKLVEAPPEVQRNSPKFL